MSALKNNCFSSAHKKDLPLEQYKGKIKLRLVKRDELKNMRNAAYKLLIP